ncbi:Mitogen-activated protein kinase 10 MPK10 [Chondrus crispus]|uniref:Mitogen-activated protein kinase 10 MPK10 n=1 Tax=Chondrus crispus TaxID=2769 RepID=R7QK36_CHOCR|nr:Mitogen-activated protein kinase 10 MPK10 [Chondrus crispus]CDF38108.1 Mitogen-activated protein kinase 10 MPK10 [Chondrus crispus]|eukprot:XP_005717977.1 Mitogen-activated protein kinase 10 MPK10 [Chondrus crispus]
MHLFTRRKGAPAPRKPSPQLVKRRVTIQLALVDRPLMTETEFLVAPRYRSLRLLGAGSYGIVVSALDASPSRAPPPRRVAIKKILAAFANAHMARHVLRELRLLRHLHHPHVVQLLDIDRPPAFAAWQDVYLVTPLLTTDLRDALLQGRLEHPPTQKKVAYQMLLALEHLHSQGIMHRDIKSRNLLLDDHYNLKLCDLGESRFYSKANRDDDIAPPVREPELTGGVSTVIQSAPELSLGAPYDAEVDIWAAGCVIAEIVRPGHAYLFDSTGKQSHVQEIIDMVGYPSDDILAILPDYGQWYLKRQRRRKGAKNRIADAMREGVDPLVVDLLENMIRFSPKDRISARAALDHPWFDDVRKPQPTVAKPYDFARSEPPSKTSKAQLKKLIWEEVVAFHPEAADG